GRDAQQFRRVAGTQRQGRLGGVVRHGCRSNEAQAAGGGPDDRWGGGRLKMPNSGRFARRCLGKKGVAGRGKICKWSVSDAERSNTDFRLLEIALVAVIGRLVTVQVVRGELVVQEFQRCRQSPQIPAQRRVLRVPLELLVEERGSSRR